jgi:hypothetical protein
MRPDRVMAAVASAPRLPHPALLALAITIAYLAAALAR